MAARASIARAVCPRTAENLNMKPKCISAAEGDEQGNGVEDVHKSEAKHVCFRNSDSQIKVNI